MRATLSRWAKGPVILLFLALYVAMVVFVLNPAQAYLQEHSIGTPPLDLMMFFGPDDVYRELVAFDHDGLQYYRRVEQTADVVYPLIYTLFFGLLWLFLLRRAVPERSFLQSLWYVPFLPITFDYLENFAIITMINQAPEKIHALAVALTLFNSAKWLLLFATLALIVTGLVLWAMRGLKKST